MSGTTIYGTPKITTSLTSFDISTSNKTKYDLRVSDDGTEINGSANISVDLNVVRVELLDWLKLGADIDGNNGSDGVRCYWRYKI